MRQSSINLTRSAKLKAKDRSSVSNSLSMKEMEENLEHSALNPGKDPTTPSIKNHKDFNRSHYVSGNNLLMHFKNGNELLKE